MPKGRNKQLTVGYKGDRSYVVRDDKIGVFSHTGQNQVKYYASISNVATPKGKVFSPKHVCLRPLVIAWQLQFALTQFRSCYTTKTPRWCS